ncbi:MAG: hypothetical protein EOO71_09615 [Myxococcaceae bacterium]|nr:MAG: hypothetical protein EOO71_09615 [Myxococcaceae bacterium]
MKPCPSDLPQTINPEAGPKRAGVETHRNLNCNHYDNCLDEAVRRGWQSFTCMKCRPCRPGKTAGGPAFQGMGCVVKKFHSIAFAWRSDVTSPPHCVRVAAG